MEFTFYDGVREIGGNKFLLKHRNTSVFLDFGKSFSKENKYFDYPLLQPFCISDLKKIQAIPDLKKLYRDSSGKPRVDCVLVTHPHADHFGYVSLLNNCIPIHLGQGARTMIQIRREIYTSGWDRRLNHLSFETFRTGEERCVKDLVYRPYSVDHSIPASYGFIIHIGAKTVVYTGDLRCHGTMKHLTELFLREIKKEEVDAMLCEGTNLAPKGEDAFIRKFEKEYRLRMGKAAPERAVKHCATEEHVEHEMINVVKNMEGLILVEICPADIDRIRTIWKVAKSTGRKLVLDSKQAYLTYELDKRDKRVKDLPCSKDSYVYLSRIRDRDAEREDAETYKKWRPKFQQDLIEKCDQIYWGPQGREEISKKADEFILCTDNASQKLLEMNEKKFHCNFVLSKSEPFNEEMVIAFDKLLHWLAFYGINKYYEIHVSGHCHKKDLKRFIIETNPRTLVPVHTEHPELMEKIVGKRIRDIRMPNFQEKIKI